MSNLALFILAVVLAMALDALIVFGRRRVKWRPISRPRIRLNLRLRLQTPETWLFSIALLAFLVTRLIGLERFPIYFFTDEAIGTVQAAELIDNGLRGPDGELFPTYFKNDQSYSISTSVYAQIVPYLLFGKSVFATRATSVLIALTGAIASALLLKNIFHLRFWWAVVLIWSITPAWFLHSRTAFEHVLWVSFFAWFLYFYLQYRTGRPRRIFLALLAGALSFYSYNGGQLGVGLMAVLLLLIDARHHWRIVRQRPRLMAAAFIWAIVLALPYVRFQAQHSSEITAHLRLLYSYWVEDIPPSQKAANFASEYLNGLRPDYWYAPDNAYDLIRHRLKGYGHILWFTLPFAVIGLLSCLKNVRQPPARAVLLTLLIAPLGGALVAVSIQRDLLFVLPAALLTAIGLDALLTRLTPRLSPRWLAGGVCAVLTLINVWLMADAVINGPTWFDDYGLYGMQYGSKEVFQTARDYLDESPQTIVTLFPQTWFNGPGALLQFFIRPDQAMQFQNFDDFFPKKQNLTAYDLFVFDQIQYDQIVADPQFSRVEVVRTISLPDGRTGFYFVRLTYSPYVEELLAAKRAARNQPETERVTINGEASRVMHTPFDTGDAAALFDGQRDTLACTYALNPAVITITFASARSLSELTLLPDLHNAEVNVRLLGDDGQLLADKTRVYRNLPSTPSVDVPFPALTAPVRALSLRLTDLNADDMGRVCLREINWR